MPTGTVKWFNGQKGFGFIQPNDGGNDVFVHISAVERAGLSGLAEGQKVTFEVKADKMRGKVSAENLALGRTFSSSTLWRHSALLICSARRFSAATRYSGATASGSTSFWAKPGEIDAAKAAMKTR